MSDAGTIITALTTDVETAVSGVTVGIVAKHPDEIGNDDLPYCRLLLVDYQVEALDFRQEERTWVIDGLLIAKDTTREAMQVLVDAIRDEVFDDPTLGSSVDRATCAPLVPYTNPDDARTYGVFTVEATKVVTP